jgi:hypothetical protein
MTTTTPPMTTFIPLERHALRSLRARYHLDRDLFGDKEREQLRFLQWLYRTGRVAS